MTMTYTQTCANDECSRPTSGKSKYCSTHKAEARKAWKAMVEEKGAEREARYAEFAELFARARQAGDAAAMAHNPTPMHVVERANPLDDNSPVVKAYAPVMDGVCGYAWITLRPGNSSIAHYAKKHCGARPAYYGGVEIWVGGYGQSMERKEAYARAFAKVLHDAGHKAYAGSRMD